MDLQGIQLPLICNPELYISVEANRPLLYHFIQLIILVYLLKYV